VLFKIGEGRVGGQTIDQLENEVDPDDYGDVEYGEDSNDGQDLSSDLEYYYRRMATIKVGADKWIGQFTDFMETWVYDPTIEGTLVMQSHRVCHTPCLPSFLSYIVGYALPTY